MSDVFASPSPPAPEPLGHAPAYAPAHPAPGAQAWYPQRFGYTPPTQGNGLAITAIVISVIALLGVLGVVLFPVAAPSIGPSSVLNGQVAPIGASATGAELARSLTHAVEDDGGSVEVIHCPDSSAVGQGLVTVCHGTVDGGAWTGMVVFEDAAGTFIVNEL